MIKVHDILIHTPSIEAQRLYRVVAIKLGGLREEGVVELEPIGYIAHYPIRIPYMMMDDMVSSGVVVVGWSLPNQACSPAAIGPSGAAGC